MKILFYAHSSTLYGANSSLVNLINGINKYRPQFETHLIIPSNSELEKVLIDRDINYSVIPHKHWIYNNFVANKWKKKGRVAFKLWYWKNKLQKQFFNKKNIKSHLKFSQEYKPDIIYVNSSLSPMGPTVAKSLQIPFIWHHRETINDLETGFYLENKQLFQKYNSKASFHIYPSIFLKESYLKFNFGLNQIVSYNGVNFESFNKNEFINSPSISIKFAIVGRIDEQKGQEEIIKVFKKFISDTKFKHANPILDIIGDGNEDYVKYLKEQASIVEIKFRGFLSPNSIFENIDYLIINAKNESFGRVVAEANCFGIPVIAVNSGALKEIVSSGENGFIYNDNEELLKILKQTSLQSIKEYSDLSRKSRIYFENNFTIEKHTKEILKVIDKLPKMNNSH